METDKEVQASVRSQRLLAITQHKEWEEVLSIMQKEYESCFNKMMDLKKDESRDKYLGGMRTIENILAKINDDIKYGITCRKQIYERIKQKNRVGTLV